MNAVMEAIVGRRSIRQFEDKEIDNETIENIIKAARFAPSADNRQPWRFIVIKNREVIRRLAEEVKKTMHKILKRRLTLKFSIKELKDWQQRQFIKAVLSQKKDFIFFDAPLLIFIISEKGIFNRESCACAAQNMMLYAHSCGLGSCWIGFAHSLNYNKAFREEFGLEKEQFIASAIIFGYPKNIPKAPLRKIEADVMKWIE